MAGAETGISLRCFQDIDEAKTVIREFPTAPRKDRRAFAVCLPRGDQSRPSTASSPKDRRAFAVCLLLDIRN